MAFPRVRRMRPSKVFAAGCVVWERLMIAGPKGRCSIHFVCSSCCHMREWKGNILEGDLEIGTREMWSTDGGDYLSAKVETRLRIPCLRDAVCTLQVATHDLPANTNY